MSQDQFKLNGMRPTAVINVQNTAAGQAVLVIQKQLGIVDRRQNVKFIIFDGNLLILLPLAAGKQCLEAFFLLFISILKLPGPVFGKLPVRTQVRVKHCKQAPDFIKLRIFRYDQFAQADRFLKFI